MYVSSSSIVHVYRHQLSPITWITSSQLNVVYYCWYCLNDLHIWVSSYDTISSYLFASIIGLQLYLRKFFNNVLAGKSTRVIILKLHMYYSSIPVNRFIQTKCACLIPYTQLFYKQLLQNRAPSEFCNIHRFTRSNNSFIHMVTK